MIIMINDEIDFSNTKSQLLFTPEGAVYINILYKALDDYRKCKKYDGRLQPMGRRALEFLMSQNEIMQINAWLLGIPLYKMMEIMYNKELFTVFKRNLKLLINDIDDYLDGKFKEVNEDDDSE